VTELEMEERRKGLCMKYQIDNRNLDSHLTLFRSGYCAVCDTAGHGSDEARSLHYHLWHDLGLRGEEYAERMEVERGRREEEYGWEKKCRLADVRRKDLIQKKEEEFFRLNADKVSIVEPKGVKTLGTYRCKLCEEDYTTPVDAMDRHLTAHEIKNVTKVYKHTPKYLPKKSTTRQRITNQPAEHRYWCKGVYSAGNNTKLFRLKIDKLTYEEGSTWECKHCGEEFEWERGASGAKVHVLAKNIEAHLKGIQTHGSCEKARESRNKRKAAAEKRRKGRGKGNIRKNNRIKSRNNALVVLRVGGKSTGSVSRNRWSSRV
jgi:transcription elongation factor Elf1